MSERAGRGAGATEAGGLTARTARLRERVRREAGPFLERPVLLAEAFRASEGEPWHNVRWAEATAHLLASCRLTILPEERLVGAYPSSTASPEFAAIDADEVLQIARHIPEYKADWESQPEDLKQYITEMEQDPEGLRALQADNVWKYIDMQAHIGVELKRGGAGNGANLGYVGSYIYWGLEALIVAGIAFSMMRTAAAEPFCRECRSWKVDEVRGPFSDFARVQRILEEGALERFPCDVSKADTVITLFTCPVCGDEGTVDVRIEKVTVNNKGETSKKRLGQLTYPGEAVTALRLASTLPEVTGTSDAAQIGGSQQTGDV